MTVSEILTVPVGGDKTAEFSFFFFFLFTGTPAAYRSPQAGGQIRAAAANLHHSHSNGRIRAASTTYTTAHSNAESLTH